MKHEIFWSESPLRQEARRMDMFLNPFIEDALKKNLTKAFHTELRTIAASKTNLIMSGFGPQRFGKSMTMLDIVEDFARYRSTKIDINNVHFTTNDMLDAMNNIVRGSINILDEQIHTSGTGARLEKQALENIEMVVGKYMLSFFFIAPKDIPHNYHYKFEVWQPGSDKPWDPDVPIEEQWVYTKSILYSHKGIPLGYIVTKTPDDKEFLKKYETKKDKFIEHVKSLKGGMRHEMFDKLTQSLIKQAGFLEEFNLSKNKRLKKLIIRQYLGGRMMSVDELSTLCDYMEYYIQIKSKSEVT